MDRLLRTAFERLIRTGNLRVITAGGSTFTCGDGTGRPAAIRFATRAAERAVLVDPALRFGEAYMDGSMVVEQGTIADVLAIVVGQHRPTGCRPGHGCDGLPATSIGGSNSSIPEGGRAATSRIITISTGSFMRCSSMPTANTAAPISRPRNNRSTTRSSPRSVTSRRSCSWRRICACSTSAAAGAGSRSTSPSWECASEYSRVSGRHECRAKPLCPSSATAPASALPPAAAGHVKL